MKLSTIFLLLISSTLQAVPVAPGRFIKQAIPGEFIVWHDASEKLNLNIVKNLGKGVSLVKIDNTKKLIGYKKFQNYRYYGNFMEGISKVNDPGFKKQYFHKLIETEKAWNITKGSEDIIVAVTDNEFQIDHEDLQGAWWTNTNEIAGNGIDDDNNGYIDDVFGYDFYDNDNDVDVHKASSHGTHVSGIIGARVNNGIGVAGIAPGVKVMPLRWFHEDMEEWTTDIIVATYKYAVDNGAKIINTSYNIDGLVEDAAYLDIIKYIGDHGIILFNSAGNSGTKNPPRQKIKDIVLVCSVNAKRKWGADKVSRFSNYGTGIDICAPGSPIYSTTQLLKPYGELSGTSMASPMAAAAAALIWSHNPNFTDKEVLKRLYESADKLESVNDAKYEGMIGHGRINLFKALK